MRAIVVIVLSILASLGPAFAGKPHIEGVVNLNTGTEAELELLPGVGPAKVRAIVAYRRVRPFRTVEELVRVKGIGAKMLRTMRPYLSVSGPSSIHVVASR